MFEFLLYKKTFLPISQKIYNILKENITKKDKILEVGCASAHISSVLKNEGYNIKGVEIRKDAVIETRKKLQKKQIDFEIIIDNVLNIQEKYDVIWSSGLLQCLNEQKRIIYIKHFAQLASKGIFIIPIRKKYLPASNIESPVAVVGCEEFSTNNIPFLLSKYYTKVCFSIIPKETIKMDIDFIYYICTNDD